MVKIICENARCSVFLAGALGDRSFVAHCNINCPICAGKGYTEVDVVDVYKLTNIIENSAFDDEDVIQEIIKLIGRNNNGV